MNRAIFFIQEVLKKKHFGLIKTLKGEVLDDLRTSIENEECISEEK